jgi:phage terminase small subunit
MRPNRCRKRGVPEYPDHLGEIAQKEWHRLVEILLATRVLTEADYIALGTLCLGL